MGSLVWVIIPTYNEAETLESTVRAVERELTDIDDWDHAILVVDDGSPDGTGQIADRLSSEIPSVQVLHRTAKTGLGRAYMAGFGAALAAGADYVVEMDADLSHDPRQLPDLLAATADADLVLGSRYVPGGAVANWGRLRRLISGGGGLYARLVLGVGVRDLTGGFKCISRQVLERIDYGRLRADGYVFQIELTYRAVQSGCRVVEVPICFKDRTAGRSKMSWRIAIEAFWLVPLLRVSGWTRDRADAVAQRSGPMLEPDRHRRRPTL